MRFFRLFRSMCRRPVSDVVILYVLMFCIVLPILSHRLYFSIYYSHSLHMGRTDPFAYAQKVNDERKKLAQTLLATQPTRSSHVLPMANSKVRLAIGFVTVDRRVRMPDGSVYNPAYLLQSVAAILGENLSTRTHLVICNVDSNASSNSDVALLSSFVPVRSKYLETKITTPSTLSDRFKKEREDYMYCMQQTLSFDPEFILILQDDALATSGALDVIGHIIQTKIQNKYRGFELIETKNFTKTFFKLFTPTYMQQDFHTTKPKRIFIHILDLTGSGIIGGTLLTIIYALFFQKVPRSYGTLYGFFVASVVCCILAALAVSRVHLMEWRRLSKHFYIMFQADNCCIPAVLYRKDTAVEFLSYLETARNNPSPIDGDMNHLVEAHGYRRYAVEPNLFSHIGMHSSIQKKVNRDFLHGFV